MLAGEVSLGKSDLRIFSSLPVCFCLFRVLVELTRIANTSANRWHIRRIDVLLLQPFPRHFREPRVVHDVLAAAVEIAKSLSQIGCNEFLKQVLRIGVDVRRVLDPPFQNVFVDLHRRATIPEGRETTQHFKDQDAEGPPGRC
jgi:hypothetical protein